MISDMKGKLKNIFSSSFLWSVLLVIILVSVYVATLLPGVGWSGDTAKFQFVGRVLGTPHTTGYPTYIFLNYFFTKLFPIGSLAYKANLLSALFSIITSLFLFRIFILFDCKRVIAFITSLIFCLTYTLWSQSIVAEVYTLNILFVTIVLYFLLKWNKTKEDRNFFIACAFYALSFGNHLTMVTLLPAIIYFIWVTDKKVFTSGRKMIMVALFFFVSALQYSYIFWRYYSPHTSYLEMQVPNFERLWWYLTGAQFKSKMFPFHITQIIHERIPMFYKLLIREYPYLILVALLGTFRFKKTVNLFLFLCFLFPTIFAINYNIFEVFVYFIPSYLIIALYIGKGLELIASLLLKKGVISNPVVLILIPLIFFAINHEYVNRRHNTIGARMIETVLQTVKKDAVILVASNKYSQYFWYYLIGEGMQRNNIYIMPYNHTYEEVKSYIDENKPFYIKQQREHIPAGLTVYCLNTYAYCYKLRNDGFTLIDVGETSLKRIVR